MVTGPTLPKNFTIAMRVLPKGERSGVTPNESPAVHVLDDRLYRLRPRAGVPRLQITNVVQAYARLGGLPEGAVHT
jgi:hypothetical protein